MPENDLTQVNQGEMIERVYREITEVLKLERDITECGTNEDAVRIYEILIPKGLTRLRKRARPPEFISGLEPCPETMISVGDVARSKQLLEKYQDIPQRELNFDSVIGDNWQDVTTVRVGRGGKISRAHDAALAEVSKAKSSDSYGLRRKALSDLWAEIRMELADDIDFFKNFSDTTYKEEDLAKEIEGFGIVER